MQNFAAICESPICIDFLEVLLDNCTHEDVGDAIEQREDYKYATYYGGVVQTMEAERVYFFLHQL